MPIARKCRAAIAALALVALSACGSDSDAGSSEEGGDVHLTTNTWVGGRANSAVAAYLLERELGYDVSVREQPESKAWKALGSGEADALLEDWGHPEQEKKYIQRKKTVVPAGDLGMQGHIGWYVPSYLEARHPEITNWKNLNEYAHLFATEETGDQGRLLEGASDFITRDKRIIENLDLNLKPVYAGSEAAQIKEMRKRAKDEEPFLTYLWRPHWLESEIELTEVDLPPHYAGCAAEEETAKCGYPETDLQKYMNADFEKNGGKAAQFLKNFQWGEEDQNDVARMIARDGMTPKNAAERWVKNNRDTWRVWLWDL